MTVREALEELRRQVLAGKVAEERLQEMETATVSPHGAKITSAGGNHGESATGIDYRLERLERVRKSWEDCRARADALRTPIQAALRTIDPLDALIVQYRYFDGMTWCEVITAMHYCYSHCHARHRLALGTLGARFEIEETGGGYRLIERRHATAAAS